MHWPNSRKQTQPGTQTVTPNQAIPAAIGTVAERVFVPPSHHFWVALLQRLKRVKVVY